MAIKEHLTGKNIAWTTSGLVVGAGALWVLWPTAPRTKTAAKQSALDQLAALRRDFLKLKTDLEPLAPDRFGPEFMYPATSPAYAVFAALDDILAGIDAAEDRLLKAVDAEQVNVIVKEVDDTVKLLRAAITGAPAPETSDVSETTPAESPGASFMDRVTAGGAVIGSVLVAYGAIKDIGIIPEWGGAGRPVAFAGSLAGGAWGLRTLFGPAGSGWDGVAHAGGIIGLLALGGVGYLAVRGVRTALRADVVERATERRLRRKLREGTLTLFS